MNYTTGTTALYQLEERCNQGIVTSMIFKSNVIGNEWVEVELNTNEKYEINITNPGQFRLKLDKLEEFVDTVTNAKLCLFIASIIRYKKEKLGIA